MNNQIQAAYINALLADASYVTLSSNGQPLSSAAILTNLTVRVTETQAKYITDNFDVLDSVETPGVLDTTGFDAVVWRGKTGTDYAGKVFVSMRGTLGTQDLLDDAVLATAGVPDRQLVAMVNWWLRITSPVGTQAQQIKYGPVGTGVYDGDGIGAGIQGQVLPFAFFSRRITS